MSSENEKPAGKRSSYAERRASYMAMRDELARGIDTLNEHGLREEGVYNKIHQAADQGRMLIDIAYTAAIMRVRRILHEDDIEHGQQQLCEFLRHAWDDKDPEPEAVYIAGALSRNKDYAMVLITQFANDQSLFEIANAMSREEASRSLKLSPESWQKFLRQLKEPVMDGGKEEARYSKPPRGR